MLVRQSLKSGETVLAIPVLVASLLMSLGQAQLSAQLAPSPCLLTAGQVDEPNEGGTTDYSEFLRPAGVIKAVMLFVEFPDARHLESTQDVYKLLVPHAQQWIREVSYGRADLEVTPVAKWYRMSKPSVDYGFSSKIPSLTAEQHKAYITEAVRLAERDVDFRQVQLVTVVAALGSQIPVSPTFQAPVGEGIFTQGIEIHEAITFGADSRRVAPKNFGAKVFVHEMGHVFGLPDLYDYLGPLSLQWRFAGGWSVMSANITGAHYFAYNKLKLGWLDADQIRCMTAPGSVEAEITPLETRGGVKAILVRTGPSTAYAVELREKIGEDAGLCDEGVLIYTVDATKANGYGSIRLIPAQQGTDPSMIDKCGILYNATYDLRPGKPPGYSDANAGISVKLLGRDARGYLVQVTWRKTD